MATAVWASTGRLENAVVGELLAGKNTENRIYCVMCQITLVNTVSQDLSA